MSKPRIVVTIEEGLITGVEYDGIDLSHVELVMIDRDTEGTDDADLTQVGEELVWFSVGEPTKLDPEDSAAIDAAVADLGKPKVEVSHFLNKYHCKGCDQSWEDSWCAACDDECPTCGKDYSPEQSEVVETFTLIIKQTECPICDNTHDF